MQIQTELSSRFIASSGKVRSVVVRDLKNRQVIYISRPVGKCYIVKRGYVRLVYVQQDGTSLTRMLLGRGAIFGDVPFRTSLFLSNEQAISSGITCVQEIDRREIEEHAIADPDYQALMLQTFSSQLQALDRRLQWQLIFPVKTRIATAILDLTCFSGGRCGHGHLIDIRLTHEEFSELVVAARPVVSKVLGELREDGIIDYTRSHICLLSLERLNSIVGVG